MKTPHPEEIKICEYRVGMHSAACAELAEVGREVQAQSPAGAGTGLDDSDYRKWAVAICACITSRPCIVAATLAFVVLGSFNCVYGAAPGAGNVTETRVVADAATGNHWLLNGRDYGETHFSPLQQISDKNVTQLGLAWSLDIDSAMGMASEPLEVDGVIYISAPRSLTYAVEAATGKVKWMFDPKVALGLSTQNSYAARVNRGVAVWEGSVYVSTGDCRLLAIDADTGRQQWSSKICDPAQTGSTGAPHIARGKVLIGYNGSDDMVRGSLAAFDAKTGKEVWRFWTVPGDPALGFETKELKDAAKTWNGKTWWRFGGGAVWDAITFDPTTNLVIFGTAGSGDVEGTTPASELPTGAKLFAGCVLAVNADTGAYVWHFQTSGKKFQTENFHTIVTDLKFKGETRHVAITAPRNGFIYLLDATSGNLLAAKPYGTVHWASSIDIATGRPVEAADLDGRVERGAGKTWWPMGFSPLTGLVYIPGYDVRTDKSPSKTALSGRLVAWDSSNQTVRWSIEQPLQTNSGVLVTGGNIVFQGEGTGEFEAFSADTGRKLWSIKTRSAIDAVPISFLLQGEQYIVIPVGWGSASRLFAPASQMATPESKRGPARLLAFKLGAKVPFPYPSIVVPQVPQPPPPSTDPATIARGSELYESHLCSGCHAPHLDGSGAWTVDGAVPDLRYAPPEVHDQWDGIVLGGSHTAQGMLSFGVDQHFPDITALSAADSHAIHAYVISEAWKAFDRQAQLAAGSQSSGSKK